MKKLFFVGAILLGQMAVQGALPPVFTQAEQQYARPCDLKSVYLSPVRVMWVQNGELIEGADRLLAPGLGQAVLADHPRCVLRSCEGKRPSLLLDFGREIQGSVQFVTGTITPKGSASIRVRMGESVSEAMSPMTAANGATNDHAIRDFEMQIPWLGVAETGRSGFRFVRIDLLDEEITLPLQEVRAVFSYRDIPYVGSFRSSNPRLDSIWMTGAYTAHLNMQEYLWDGVKRDRLIWLGDMHPELCTILSVFGDNEVLSKTLDQAKAITPLPGWMNGMCAYSLWWVMIQRDYYRYTGNKEYLRAQHDYLAGLLRQIAATVDAEGYEHLKGSRFLDWPTSRDAKAIDAGLHALTLMTLEAGEEMAAVLNDTSLQTLCAEVVSRMRKVVPDYRASKQSAALIALSGIVPAGEVNDQVLKVGGAAHFSTFYGYYMLEAQAKAGDYQGAMNNISTYWGGMLDLGATTFWEDFDLEWLKNAARIDEIVPKGKVDVHKAYGAYCYTGLRHSFCHGWASGPTAWLSRYVLGITILEPGCTKVRIDPHLGDLDWVEGTFPTPYGAIRVRHEKRPDGKIVSSISAPKQVKVVRP